MRKMQKIKTSYDKGLYAERLCVWALRLKGYRILNQRYKTKLGEIDIIAKRFKTIIFVEVKMRKSITDAAQAITVKNQKRIIRTAKMFLNISVHYNWDVVRFDVMLVSPRKIWPIHIKNAFGA
jgi:putative endonuclease